MKILYIITGLGMGGAEQQVIALSEEMSRRGYDVEIVALKKRLTRITPLNVNIIVHDLNLNLNVCHLFYSVLKLFRIIREISPDIIHSHMIHANILARIYRFLYTKTPLICTAHSNIEGGALGMFLYRVTSRYCDFFSNVSQSAVERFYFKKASRKGKLHCIYNGIDTERFIFNHHSRNEVRSELCIESDEKVILTVGRFNEAKDYPNLISAFALLKKLKIKSKCRLLIVGDGPLRKNIENLVFKYNITSFVTFLGLRNDVEKIMSAADCFVLASAWEGFGLVVAEAMSCSLPVVATDCGGVAEVMGNNWILVEPRNSDALCRAMLDILSYDNEQIVSQARIARKHIVNKFGMTSICDRWESIYTLVCK